MKSERLIIPIFLLLSIPCSGQNMVGVLTELQKESIYELNSSDERYYSSYDITSGISIGVCLKKQRSRENCFFATLTFSSTNLKYEVEKLQLNASFANRTEHRVFKVSGSADWTWSFVKSGNFTSSIGLGGSLSYIYVSESEGQGYNFSLTEQITANGDTVLLPGSVNWSSKERRPETISPLLISLEAILHCEYSVSPRISLMTFVRPKFGILPLVIENDFEFNSIRGMYYTLGVAYEFTSTRE